MTTPWRLGLAITAATQLAFATPAGGSERAKSNAEQLATASAQVSQMTARSERIQRWLRSARSHANRQRSRCLDSNLSQSHAIERLAREELARMRKAAASSNDRACSLHGSRLHHFAARSRYVSRAASSCR